MLSNAIFKLVNLLAILGYLFNIISMFAKYHTDAADIVNGIFHIFFIIALLYIEIDQRAMISNVVPFMFSFVGRGIFYIWLAWTTFQIEILSVIGTIITFIIGVIYVLLFVLKNFKAPQHMSYDDTLFSGASKFFSDECEYFLPTTSDDVNTSTNQPRGADDYTSVV